MIERISRGRAGGRRRPGRLAAALSAVGASFLVALVLWSGMASTVWAQQRDEARRQRPDEEGRRQQADEKPQPAGDDKQGQGQTQEPEVRVNERIMVVGSASAVEDIPGSAHYLGIDQLERQAQAVPDVHRLLRQLPGVYIQEEEGYGLRPNIGLRGSGSERSSKVTLMEDGVLIAPAPYAAPAAYYFPVAGRMQAIEVRKGSSQIKYGPSSNGGALNLISTSIPYDLDVRAELAGGADRTGRAHLSVGDSTTRFGWLLETFQISTDGFKQLDAPVRRDTGFNVQDYLAKLRLNTDRAGPVYQELLVKAGYTKQVSDETYLGLTDADFERAPLSRYAASQEDVFRSDHRQVQARYFLAPSERFDITLVAYRNDFARNWYKLQSIGGVGIADILDEPDRFATQLATARGADSEADALKVRANNREYYSEGVQGVLGLRLDAAGADHAVEVGVRWHRDQEDRLQHEDGFQMNDGRMSLTSRGAPGSQANRVADADAWALFVQGRVRFGHWTLTPGLRFETIDLARTDYSTSDPGRLRGPSGVRTNDVEVFVPGIGVGFEARPGLSVFAGVHKGFSPPGPGSSEETEAEESVNYEVGVRVRRRSLRVEAAGFFNDYSNLLGADTLSSGGEGTGDLFNGGAVDVRGFEASAEYDVAEAASLRWSLPLRVAYTYTASEFRNSFDSDFEPWGSVGAGDELPYLPEHQLHAGVGLAVDRWSFDLTAGYIGRMRTEAGQGPIATGRGTDAALVLDLTGSLRLADGAEVFAAVQNLGNLTYVAARRPAGARPGLPRTWAAGLRLDF